MSDIYAATYWTQEFDITEADLDRIATRIRETGQAHDLTELAKRVVLGRLRFGPETSAPVQGTWAEDPSVRLWDPAGDWKVGDHVVVARLVEEGVYRAFIGEITEVMPDRVTMQLDRGEGSASYLRAPPGSEQARKWHAKVLEVVARKRSAPELDEQVEAILLTYGDRIVSRLLDALRADKRFVRLAGRWFLRELAVLPTEEQLTSLAWAMVRMDEPQPTDALVSLVRPPLPQGDPGLFGLYLAMRDRPDHFRNADPEQRPRWVLVGPPPGSCVPRHAAYDPQTYEVLCLPGQPIPPETVQRLWDLDLLKVVI